jgi:cytochrome P450
VVTRSVPMAPRGRGNSHARQLREDRVGSMQRWAAAHEDLVGLRFGPFRAFLVTSPALVEDVVAKQHRAFRRDYVVRYSTRTFGRSLLTSSGARHVRQRRLAQPAFHRERMESYVGAMTAAASRELDGWQHGQRRDIHADMMRLTLDVAGRTLFGIDVQEDCTRLGSASDVVLHSFTHRMDVGWPYPDWVPTPSNRRLSRALEVIDEVVARAVEEARAGGSAEHLVALLLAASDEADARRGRRELRDEALTFLLAGHETTALALTFGLYLLSQHAHVADRVEAEVDAVLGGRTPTLADVPRLPLINGVLRETMRLYPPSYAFGREAVRDVDVGGYRIPRRAMVIISQWVLHRDPRLWDDPERFDPDRWTSELLQRLPRYAYLPFGGGPHRCIGEHFAWTEATVVLAMILQRWSLAHIADHVVELEPLITLRPRNGMAMTIRARHPARLR